MRVINIHTEQSGTIVHSVTPKICKYGRYDLYAILWDGDKETEWVSVNSFVYESSVAEVLPWSSGLVH